MNKMKVSQFYGDLDQLFNAGSDPRPDIARLSGIMSDNGLTPYIYVRIALRHLVEGDYPESIRMLHFAEKFLNVFFKPGTAEEKEFSVEMFIVREMLLFLKEKFSDLPCITGFETHQ